MALKTQNIYVFARNVRVLNSNKGEILIIWLLCFRGYQYGFLFQENGNLYELNMHENVKPIGEQKIKSLFNKAKVIWNLK